MRTAVSTVMCRQPTYTNTLQWLRGQVYLPKAYQTWHLILDSIQGLLSTGSQSDVCHFVGQFTRHAGGTSAVTDELSKGGWTAWSRGLDCFFIGAIEKCY